MSDGELREYIRNSVKVITKKLNINIPEINFNYSNEPVCYKHSYKLIYIPIPHLKKLLISLDTNLHPLELINPLDKTYFIIAHEIAHYFQHSKFPQWFEKYKKIYFDTNYKTAKEYAQIKLEKNATKIACILFKERKNECIKNS